MDRERERLRDGENERETYLSLNTVDRESTVLGVNGFPTKINSLLSDQISDETWYKWLHQPPPYTQTVTIKTDNPYQTT